MAAASPAKSSGDSPSVALSSKSLRGLNKPKCIKCGNVARSRCPYQSCKNCCAKAQNPCHIHVLKGNSSFPDKPPSTNSPLFDQQSSEVSHTGNFQRLRQLSNNFAQFSNLQTSFRSRKPLTKKDAQVINEWRFLKLKEFKDANVEAESEAFDRYLQNVVLLEEVFWVNTDFDEEQSARVKSSGGGDNSEGTIHCLKLKLRSNTATTESFRKRIQCIVDEGLKKVRKVDEAEDGLSDTEGQGGTKKVKVMAIALSELNDKLNGARNEDELKACWEMASQIFTKKSQRVSPFCMVKDFSNFPPKWVNPVTIDEEALSRIDEQFSSLQEIEDL